ncbi:hypothetical protein RchiOBHm_Chr6g0249651 [Rosa chinensis]|uniref:Uncharacterized protein n=1 Tax=Rosa chinensis TaxID=74649 RepID=A0A2P6PKC4_ROSCH|nr:hypothetical protein RchiOBHm_Chr6g0249651 [Rosa chinensis]
MILSATKSATTTFLLSISLASLLVLFYSEYHITMSCLLLIGASLVFALVVIAARASMIAWITVLVMLTFAGNRRRVLVRRGSLITSDVAVHLFRVVIKERGLLAVACAALLSLTAVLGLTL